VAHARLMLRREADGRELEGLLAAPLPGGAWLLLAGSTVLLFLGLPVALSWPAL